MTFYFYVYIILLRLFNFLSLLRHGVTESILGPRPLQAPDAKIYRYLNFQNFL